MFSFDIFVDRTEVRLELSTSSLALNSLLLPRTASFSASMTSAMQTCLALAEAQGLVDVSLVADAHGSVATTLA